MSGKSFIQRILNKAKGITDEALLLSKQFVRYLDSIVKGMSMRFVNPVKIHLYEGEPEETACTDDKEIRCNINSSLIATTDGRESTRLEKVHGIRGTIAHEVGHIIYTPFKLYQYIDNRYRTEKTLYPLCDYKDEVENAEELLSYLATPKGDEIYRLFLTEFRNILEDSYVDEQITSGRYAIGEDRLFILRKFKQECPTFDEMLEAQNKMSKTEEHNAVMSKLSELNIALHLFFMYGKLHILPTHTDEQEEHKAFQTLFGIAPEINAIMSDDDPLIRTGRIEKIMCHYWPIIKDYLDALPDNDEQSNDNCQNNQPFEQPSSGNDKDAPMPTGDGGSGNSANDNSAKQPSSDQQNNMQQMMSSDAGNEGTQNDDQNDSSGANASSQNSNQSSNSRQNATGGQSAEGSGSDSDADSSLSKLIDSMAKDMAKQEVEMEDEKADLDGFGKYANSLPSPCSMSIHYDFEPNESEYESIKDSVEQYSKALIRFFREKIHAKNGYKMNGFYSGTKISMTSIATNNMAMFEKKKLPGDAPKLAVAYLGDESGSMGGEKRDVNMLTAETVFSFCDALNIPVGVYGHSYSNKLDLNVYSNFRKSPRDRFRISNMTAGGCNLDGYAIRMVAQKLLQQPGEYHVMIITSDGAPSAYMSREKGVEDIKKAVEEYNRKGVHFIAAAMDQDKEMIKNIYGSAYLDISDLNTMPRRMINMLAKYLAV